MSLYGVAQDEDSTDQLSVAEIRQFRQREATRTVRAWLSNNGLAVGGVVVSLVILAFFALSDPFMPSVLAAGWMRFAVAAGVVWIQILIVANWQWDRRRSRQAESRLLQGQADLRTMLTLQQTETVSLRTQVILMRAEMQALLGSLPEGVVNYANRRAIEVSIDALQKLASTGTDEGRPVGVATVTSIQAAHRGRKG